MRIYFDKPNVTPAEKHFDLLLLDNAIQQLYVIKSGVESGFVLSGEFFTLLSDIVVSSKE